MSDLYLIFDGYRLQLCYDHAFREPLDWTALRHTRNAFAQAVRHSSGMRFVNLNSLFVTGQPGEAVWRWEKRERARANATAILPSDRDLKKVVSPIDVYLEDLVIDERGDVRQPWTCDLAMVERIDLAKKGDHVAICTIDGQPRRDPKLGKAPGIAAALSRAVKDRGAQAWLFTFSGMGAPGKHLLDVVPAENRFQCRFAPENGRPTLWTARSGAADWICRQLDTDWAA